MVQVVSNISKAIDSEAKVNLYSMKGSFKEFDVTEFKRWYQSAKIVNIKYHDSNDKKFTPNKLKKLIKTTNRDKAITGIYNVAAGLATDKNDKMDKKLKLSPRAPFKAIKDINDAEKLLNQSMQIKNHPDHAESDDTSSNLQGKPKKDFKDHPTLNLKKTIQDIFKNIKNVFSKEEGNQPNDTLLRTTVIKKVILYLILSFMALASAYLGYLTIYQQYQTYLFKIDSMYKTTVYHNMTISVINEYAYRELALSRPLSDTYTAEMKRRDELDVAWRINEFKTQLNSLDINTNVRNDLFFTSIGSVQEKFLMRYAANDTDIHIASRYTILMLLLEKLLTAEKSIADKQEALYFIQDNFLSIINKYFLDSFDMTNSENDKIVSDGRVETSHLESGYSLHCAIRIDLCSVHSDDLWYQRRDPALHFRSTVCLQFH